jgi:hypothetical protein
MKEWSEGKKLTLLGDVMKYKILQTLTNEQKISYCFSHIYFFQKYFDKSLSKFIFCKLRKLLCDFDLCLDFCLGVNKSNESIVEKNMYVGGSVVYFLLRKFLRNIQTKDFTSKSLFDILKLANDLNIFWINPKPGHDVEICDSYWGYNPLEYQNVHFHKRKIINQIQISPLKSNRVFGEWIEDEDDFDFKDIDCHLNCVRFFQIAKNDYSISNSKSLRNFMNLSFPLEICENYFKFEDQKLEEVFVKNLYSLYWNISKVNLKNAGENIISNITKYKQRGVKFCNVKISELNNFSQTFQIEKQKHYEVGNAELISNKLKIISTIPFISHISHIQLFQPIIDEVQKLNKRFKIYKINATNLTMIQLQKYKDFGRNFILINIIDNSTFILGIDMKKTKCFKENCIYNFFKKPHLHFIYQGKDAPKNQIFPLKN